MDLPKEKFAAYTLCNNHHASGENNNPMSIRPPLDVQWTSV